MLMIAAESASAASLGELAFAARSSPRIAAASLQRRRLRARARARSRRTCSSASPQVLSARGAQRFASTNYERLAHIRTHGRARGRGRGRGRGRDRDRARARSHTESSVSAACAERARRSFHDARYITPPPPPLALSSTGGACSPAAAPPWNIWISTRVLAALAHVTLTGSSSINASTCDVMCTGDHTSGSPACPPPESCVLVHSWLCSLLASSATKPHVVLTLLSWRDLGHSDVFD